MFTKIKIKGDKIMSKNIYGEDINFDELEQHVYEDEDDDVFYICPIKKQLIMQGQQT